MVKPNERLGNYEVATSADGSVLVLGSGAGGVTYRGRHIHLGTEVAIKVLIRRKNLLQKDRDAFLSEARSAASLAHPRIARILDFGESGQQHPYYVMELCEGGSLEDLGRKSGPPPAPTCIQWLIESASALAHAHQKGILHRDIKPSNLLVARENHSASIKLIDFGLADHADQADGADHVIGTPHFAAPEQLRGRAEPASDVFSLGATFLWLLTGSHLSQGDVKAVIAERLETSGYQSLLGRLPPPWQTLLGRMLEVDPSRRPRDGGEVLELIRAVFPDHSGEPVAWEQAGDFHSPGSSAPPPTRWLDLPDSPWSAHWIEAGTPLTTESGISVRARRHDAETIYDVLRFENPPPDLIPLLTDQGDLVARHAEQLGLAPVILERGDQWWSVAWPAMGSEDALSWVRKGQTASTAEILAALEPIAAALDGLKSGGLEHLEIHPSMLIVGAPTDEAAALKFSFAVPLPVSTSADAAADSASTMRGAMGAGLPARFAACSYQLLSGRTLPPAAFVNARAYQAIPKLTERSNRFLSSAIAGTIDGATCQDVIRGLAHEERIPGASLSGGSQMLSRGSSTMRSALSLGSPAQSSAAILPPPVPSAPDSAEPPPPPAAAPAPIQGKRSKLPAIIAAGAAALILMAAAGAWMFLKKPASTATPAPPPQATTPTPTTPAPAAPPPATSTPSKSLVKVPADAATFADAIQLCDPGGTIEIAGGTYPEAIVITKSVTLASTPAAVFEDRGLGSSLVVVRGPVEVTFRNIQFKNTQPEATTKPEDSPPLVLIADGPRVRFDGCVIEGSPGNGVSLADKAGATFSNCRIRKNRGYGINATSGSTVDVSLSEIQESGRSGISAMNLGSSVTLGNGSTVAENSLNGVEIGNGAELKASGAEINANQKVGLVVEDSGSLATLEASCLVSANRIYGIGVRNSGRVVLTDSAVRENTQNGLFAEAGGQAEIRNCHFQSNGTIGIYLVGGSSSSVSISKSIIEGHSDAGAAFVQGIGKVTESRFLNNTMAIFFGDQSSGSATGNAVGPGSVGDLIVTENAGQVELRDNSADATR